MIVKGDIVSHYGKMYKVIGVCSKGGKDVLKLRNIDGRTIIYNVNTEKVIKVKEKNK